MPQTIFSRLTSPKVPVFEEIVPLSDGFVTGINDIGFRCVGRLFGVIQGLFLNLLIRIVFVIFRNRVLSFPLPVFIVFVTF